MSERHQFRAKWHSYNNGIYFVTICSHEKRHIFGRIIHGKMILNRIGQLTDLCITEISSHHKGVEIWNHVVMPNHIHMLVAISSVGAQYIAPTATTISPNMGCLRHANHLPQCENFHYNSVLSVVIRSFKGAVSRECRKHGREWAQCIAPLQENKIWQRNYHERIIRDQYTFEKVMNYISTNPEKWDKDCFKDLKS